MTNGDHKEQQTKFEASDILGLVHKGFKRALGVLSICRLRTSLKSRAEACIESNYSGYASDQQKNWLYFVLNCIAQKFLCSIMYAPIVAGLWTFLTFPAGPLEASDSRTEHRQKTCRCCMSFCIQAHVNSALVP